jgi:hypothetical protein
MLKQESKVFFSGFFTFLPPGGAGPLLPRRGLWAILLLLLLRHHPRRLPPAPPTESDAEESKLQSSVWRSPHPVNYKKRPFRR